MVVKQFRSAGPMTLNNYTEEEIEHLRRVTGIKDSKIKYIVWVQEVGENGTPHLQIYAQAFEKLAVAVFVIDWRNSICDRTERAAKSSFEQFDHRSRIFT